jgi:tetratricopeptide (TPR) repeat protein
MKNRFRAALIIPVLILGALCLSAPVYAQNPQLPSLEADLLAYEYGRRVVVGYNWQDLAEIALWASSVGQAPLVGRETADLISLVQNAVSALLASPDLPRDPRARGEYILTFLHERYFKAYSELQTRLDEIFTSGRYNCVSSAVFYLILAEAAGMNVRGVMTRDHAFVTVDTGTEVIDVETTNPYGFDPGSRREFHDGFGRLTGFAYVPARNYRDRADISPIELVSLILNNRIAEAERRNRFNEAVSLAVNRSILLLGRKNPVNSPFFPDPQEDLMDRLFNYGASLVNTGQEAAALGWAAFAGAKYPDDERWQEFIYTSLNNLLVRRIRSKRLNEARALLWEYKPALTPANYNRLDGVVLDAELVQLSQEARNAGEAQEVLDAIDDAQARSVLSDSRADEVRTFIILKEGERLAAVQGSQAAIAYTEDAIRRYGRSSRLDNALRVYSANRVAELHNNFADLYNSKRYDEAFRLIRTALEEYPNDRRLREDLRLAERAVQNP